ncbi:carbohydrate ABC transporter permease [Plantibacter sp. YIM 135249]|uniref:carbohydrate ABC transporter permease n=1 Tax=Plantibacter sp. YIM 135249 TaxID=3423918 RepID=UPI003D34B9B5
MTRELTSAPTAPVSAPTRGTGRHPGLLATLVRARWSYLYLLPFVLLTGAFVLYPIGASLVYTVFKWDGIGSPSAFVGLTNFVNVMNDDFFWKAVTHSLIYTAVLVPVQLLLALVLAVVLNDRKLRFSTFYRSLFFLPAVMSPAIIGVIFQLLISNFGQGLGEVFGTKLGLLADPKTALGVVIAIGIWNTLGYNLIYFLAALQTIPEELYEAGRIDGASWFQLFRHITIPGLATIGPIIVFLAIIGSLQVFDLVQVLTGGGPYFATSVVNTYIYQMAFGGAGSGGVPVTPDVGLASSAAFLYGLLLIAIAAVQAIVLGRMRRRAQPTGEVTTA